MLGNRVNPKHQHDPGIQKKCSFEHQHGSLIQHGLATVQQGKAGLEAPRTHSLARMGWKYRIMPENRQRKQIHNIGAFIWTCKKSG